MRELAPQRTAARTAISDNANALPLYQEQIAANKTAYDKTQDVLDQSNTDAAAKESIRRFGLTQATAKIKQDALDAKNKQDRLDKMNERVNATYINPTSQETFTVQIGVNGQAQVFDIDNKPTGMNITDLVPYKDWIAQQKALAEAKSGGGGLSLNALQTGLDKLEKKIKPVESMQLAVERLDAVLAPYAKGGAKEGETIGGIGGIGGMRGEGITGHIGDVWRYLDDATTSGQGDSAEMSNAVAGVIAPIIRNQAGLAQTMSETKKVIDAYGLQNISNEEDMLKALPYIKEAIKRDLDRINSTTMPEVREVYGNAAGNLNAFDRNSQNLDFTQRYDPRPKLNAIPAPAGVDPMIWGRYSPEKQQQYIDKFGG
tara:strand:- start:2294 stop:3409 length:1116 start_codon:yes stop_codon:yes gene_type:complete